MVAIKIGDHELELKTARRKNVFTKEDCKYDPHIQEEKLKLQDKDKLSGTYGITRVAPNGKHCVDVIVKLKPGELVPEGLTLFQTESIGGGSYILTETVDGQEIRKVSVNSQNKQVSPRKTSSRKSERTEDTKPPSFIFTGKVDLQKVVDVRKGVTSLKAARLVHLHLFHSVPAIRCDPNSLDAGARKNGESYPGLDGSDVIVGIVDIGCDFRHQNFRRKSGETRILYLWDQTDDETGKNGDTSPKEYRYGREFTSDIINHALSGGDENAYSVLGYTPPIAAHGTHVMDIATGNGGELDLFNGKPGTLAPQPSVAGVAPNAQIIFVQLEHIEGSFLANSRRLLEAVDYIFKKADALNLPAVVNLSLSTTGGPHDGTTLMEQAFEALVNQKPGRAIVTSAGNAYDLKSHASGEIGPDTKPAILLWETDPFNTDPRGATNEMEIWYPKGTELVATLSVPTNEKATEWAVLGTVPLGETQILLAGNERIGRISHRKEDPNNHDNLIDIRLPHLRDVPGPWKIELTSKTGTVSYDAWIEQSERGLSRFSSEADSRITLGSICCGNGTLTVGAYDTSERAVLAPPYEATSAGPIRTTKANEKKQLRAKPELSAPGVNVVAARAQGGVTIMSGTSMGAPHVTGLIAILFQLAHKSGRGPLSFDRTCDFLAKGLTGIQDPTLKPRLGDGRINGTSTVRNLLETVMRSVYLDLRLTRPEVRTFADSKPTIDDLFSFLKNHAAINGHNGFKVDEFVKFFEDQLGRNEFFRLTMASLS